MPRKTVLDLQEMKASSQKIAMVTAYDATMARLHAAAHQANAGIAGTSVVPVVGPEEVETLGSQWPQQLLKILKGKNPKP